MKIVLVATLLLFAGAVALPVAAADQIESSTVPVVGCPGGLVGDVCKRVKAICEEIISPCL